MIYIHSYIPLYQSLCFNCRSWLKFTGHLPMDQEDQNPIQEGIWSHCFDGHRSVSCTCFREISGTYSSPASILQKPPSILSDRQPPYITHRYAVHTSYIIFQPIRFLIIFKMHSMLLWSVFNVLSTVWVLWISHTLRSNQWVTHCETSLHVAALRSHLSWTI